MPEFRLYIDETGDHTKCTEEKSPIGSRYLGLVGVMLERHESYDAFAKALEDFKRKHLPYDADEQPPILHRKEIINLSGPFYRLQDSARRAAFDGDLLALLNKTPFHVIAIVVDKLTHGRADYRLLQHSYHYCLLAMLERYCGLLKIRGSTGDVMVESRGSREDHDFETAYSELWEHGSGGKGFLSTAVARATLTSKKPKMKKASEHCRPATGRPHRAYCHPRRAQERGWIDRHLGFSLCR